MQEVVDQLYERMTFDMMKADLVTMILTAPVMEYNTAGFTGKSYELQFHLRDGTILTSAYWPDSGEMHEGEENIVLPQAFRVALEQAMRK